VARRARQFHRTISHIPSLTVKHAVDFFGRGSPDTVYGFELFGACCRYAGWGTECREELLGFCGTDVGDGLEEKALMLGEPLGVVPVSSRWSGGAALELVCGVQDEVGGFLGA
jgi:hypothetical protein